MTNYLKVKEAAERLDVSQATIYGLIDRGEIWFTRISKRLYRIPEDKFEEYIKDRTHGVKQVRHF